MKIDSEIPDSSILFRTPPGDVVFPTVILVQGFGMSLHEYKNAHDEITDHLVASGFGTIQFDFSYMKDYTDETDTEISLDKRASEVNGIIQWALENKKVDPTRIGMLGMSFGVSTLLLANLANIKSLVLVSGLGFRPHKFVDRYKKKGAVVNRDGETRFPRTSGKTTIIQKDFWPSFDRFDQETIVQKLDIPVLVIHGDKDTYIATDDMRKVFNEITRGQKKLKIFPGGDHGIIDVPAHMRNEYLADIVTWFRQTL